MTATVAPPEAREIIAEGKAAIGEGGLTGARKAAEAQALRSAVEKTAGVYVGARSLTQNYALVRDQVETRSAGFATLKEVVRETDGPQEVSVTVRALVSLRPLASELKSLNLTRAWRVFVKGRSPDGGKPGPHARTAESVVETSLTDAGFVAVSAEKDADLTVVVRPTFDTLSQTPLTTAAGPMTMNSVRADVQVRAVRTQTGEIVSALSADDIALHINIETARDEAVRSAAEAVAPRLSDALLVLPARDAQPVDLVVSGLKHIEDVERMEEALNAVTGVQEVTRREWVKGRAVWELEVYSEAQPTLAHALEASDAMRPFHLAVSSETRARITAGVAGAPAAPQKVAKRRKGGGGG